jgi:hypothetical protein
MRKVSALSSNLDTVATRCVSPQYCGQLSWGQAPMLEARQESVPDSDRPGNSPSLVIARVLVSLTGTVWKRRRIG